MGTITPPATPAFSFNAPDLPTVNYVDPTKYNDLTALTAAENANSQGLASSQNALERSVFNQYQQAVSGQGSALDRYNKLAGQMNIPLYQQQMTTIQGLLNRLSDNLNTRAQGTFMNQSQRDQLEAVEGKSLRNQLAPIATAETTAEGNLSRMMDYYNQDSQKQLDPLRMYLSNLGSSFSRQMSGLGSSNDAASKSLSDRLDRQRQAQLDAEARDFQQFQKQQAIKDMAIKQAQLSLQQQQAKLGIGSDFNGTLAAIKSRLDQQTAQTKALSQGQQNSAAFLLNNNVNPNDVRNYTSAGHRQGYMDTVGRVFSGLFDPMSAAGEIGSWFN